MRVANRLMYYRVNLKRLERRQEDSKHKIFPFCLTFLSVYPSVTPAFSMANYVLGEDLNKTEQNFLHTSSLSIEQNLCLTIVFELTFASMSALLGLPVFSTHLSGYKCMDHLPNAFALFKSIPSQRIIIFFFT